MSAIIAAIAYAFWHFQSSDERTQMPRVAAVPERLAPLADPVPRPAEPAPPAAVAAPAPAPMAAPQPAPAVEPPARPEAPAAETPTVTAAAPASAPTPSAPAAIPAAPADASAQPRVFGEIGGHRIVIRATADSWIQVRDTSGTVVFTRVMRAGDSYNVPNRSGLSLYTGSAGALEFTVDGKTAPSVGQPGAVRRDVILDPDRLLAGTAVLDQKRPSSAADPQAPRPAATPASGG
jgi:cytoskeleton protein RodZ